MEDVTVLCENCEERPPISVTDDDVDLCAECELALVDEMAMHEEECFCEGEHRKLTDTHRVDCEYCTCGLAARVERRKVWLREQIVNAPAVSDAIASV